jgi:FAD/FMN-containing dehydrogenase
MDRREFLLGATSVLLVRRARVEPKLRELQRLVRGPVLLPTSPGYDVARLEYNARFDQHPLAVVRPRDARDVQAVVRWALRYDVPVIPRSGGHSYAGYSSGSGVVVDLGGYTGLRIERGSAVIGPGARLINVYARLAANGLAISAGSCPTVGFGGLALGGGIGLASRKLGTASDNVTSMVVVTGDGRMLTVSAKSHPDLFWALRGAGGRNFGIVTSFRVRTARIAGGSWFVSTLPWSSAPELVARWQQWAPNADPRLFTICSLGNQTLQVFGQFLGSEQQLRAALPSWLPVTRSGSAVYLDLMKRWANCLSDSVPACAEVHRTSFAAKSDYVGKPMPAQAVRTIQTFLERGRGSLLMDSYGGAIRHGGGSCGHRDALCSLQYYTSWSGDGSANLAWLREFHAAMRPYVTGGAYVNYIDPELADWKRAYYGSRYPRLAAVRRRYDPHRVFRFKQGIV